MKAKQNKGPAVMIATVLSVANIAFDAPISTKSGSVAGGGTVTINADSGVVTITGLTTAAGATTIVTVNNTSVKNSSALASINGYTGVLGTDGIPVIAVLDVASPGELKITIANVGANALAGDVDVAFQIAQEIV